jgi:hypothetical protein
MTTFTHEARELSISELDVVSGGDMLGIAINAAENYMDGLFGRLINAVHQPITSSPSMSLHMRF